MKNWIPPKTITGSAAVGPSYFARPSIDDHFWREIRKGNHILFTAPRRVGKTSIMLNLANNCPPGFVCLYQNIEGVRTKNEFYERLFHLVLQCHERSNVEHVQSFLRDLKQRVLGSEFSAEGIKINPNLDYRIKMRELIPELSRATFHTVIFLDEFAEVINTLKKNNQEEDAISILHELRELRNEKAFKNFTIVYAGSIALEHVIRTLDRPKLINDLHRIPCEALSFEEAQALIAQLLADATIKFNKECEIHLIKEIGHLLPYYIQLVIEEVDSLAMLAKTPIVTTTMIDQAFKKMIERSSNFEDWISRLERYHSQDFDFFNVILTQAAHEGRVTIREVYNFASDARFKKEKNYMDFVHQLMNDGYLFGSREDGYRFLSPLLEKFWKEKFPIYE